MGRVTKGRYKLVVNEDTFKRLDPIIYDCSKTIKTHFYYRKDAIKSLTNFHKGNKESGFILSRQQLQRLATHYKNDFYISDCGHNLLLFKKKGKIKHE